MDTEIKVCRFCNKPVRGRTDKKYCNDYCRNAFNNKLIEKDAKQMRYINNALWRNRKILEELLQATTDRKKTYREILISKGFQFKYFTHIRQSKNGRLFYCCYDYSYNPQENDRYLIVRQKDKKA